MGPETAELVSNQLRKGIGVVLLLFHFLPREQRDIDGDKDKPGATVWPRSGLAGWWIFSLKYEHKWESPPYDQKVELSSQMEYPSFQNEL